MEPKQSFSTQALVILVAGNAILVAVALLASTWLAIVAGAVITVALWLGLRSAAAGDLDRALRIGPDQSISPPATEQAAETPRPAKQAPEAAAIQMLAILQRKGRLIDFLQEDIRAFNDAQIGAAVRNVHEGCRQALEEHVTLVPVMSQPEGSTVTIESGFDAREVRVTGSVDGDPPFTGELRHRGWRIEKLDLPEMMQVQSRIVAAAEVEV